MTVYTRYKEDTPSDATKLPHWLGKLQPIPRDTQVQSCLNGEIEFAQRTPSGWNNFD